MRILTNGCGQVTTQAFQPGPRETALEKRNTLFGLPIPIGHFAVLDFENSRVALYQHWRKVGRPADYLRGYWGAEADVPPGIA